MVENDRLSKGSAGFLILGVDLPKDPLLSRGRHLEGTILDGIPASYSGRRRNASPARVLIVPK